MSPKVPMYNLREIGKQPRKLDVKRASPESSPGRGWGERKSEEGAGPVGSEQGDGSRRVSAMAAAAEDEDEDEEEEDVDGPGVERERRDGWW
jgi:hypothetical protein